MARDILASPRHRKKALFGGSPEPHREHSNYAAISTAPEENHAERNETAGTAIEMHRQGEEGGDGDVDASGYWEQRTVYIDMLAAQKFVPRGSSPGADRRFFASWVA
jgi:hypothetical protein